ncbi:MAG: response regulator [Candidatus Aenigmarchaeota archaeon]|nr:response regulator [Candidatus Aenigmarchaeota archaeon]
MVKKTVIAEQNPLGHTTADYMQAVAPNALVEYCSTGQELVERVKAGGYSLAFVGCCVDGTRDGPDIVRAIRAVDSSLPVYVLSIESGNDDASTRERAEEAGATGYLRHLSNIQELEGIIKHHLG